MLRIIAGKHRSRQLEQPPLEITRPTMDRIREAIFSSIQFKIENALVLDLFAGSGAMGLEAISRGAMKVIAVDNNAKAIEVINRNCATLGINNLVAVKADVLEHLDRLSGTKFDYIFMDPPYKEIDLYNLVLEKLAKIQLLKPLGVIILETSFDKAIKIPEQFALQKHKKYGKTNILMVANNI